MSVWFESWIRCKCPKCGKSNWLYQTHSERAYPSEDCFALKCWSCGAMEWLDEECKFMASMHHEDGDDGLNVEEYAKLGKETP